MKHPHAEILKAFANDMNISIERRNQVDGNWYESSINDVICYDRSELRIKPAMRSITLADGTALEWPEPMLVAPADGQLHWQTHSGEVRRSNWCGSNYQAELLKTGFCHLTKEAAQQHRRAIVLANGGEL